MVLSVCISILLTKVDDLPIILYNDVLQHLLFFFLTGSRSFAIVVEYWYTCRSLALILNILSNWVGNHFYP